MISKIYDIGGNVEMRVNTGNFCIRCKSIYPEWINISPSMFDSMKMIAKCAFGIHTPRRSYKAQYANIYISVYSNLLGNFLRLDSPFFDGEGQKYILISYHMFCNMEILSEQVWGVWRESEKPKLWEWDGSYLLTRE